MYCAKMLFHTVLKTMGQILELLLLIVFNITLRHKVSYRPFSCRLFILQYKLYSFYMLCVTLIVTSWIRPFVFRIISFVFEKYLYKFTTYGTHQKVIIFDMIFFCPLWGWNYFGYAGRNFQAAHDKVVHVLLVSLYSNLQIKILVLDNFQQLFTLQNNGVVFWFFKHL